MSAWCQSGSVKSEWCQRDVSVISVMWCRWSVWGCGCWWSSSAGLGSEYLCPLWSCSKLDSNICSYIVINAKIIWTRGVFGSLRMSLLHLQRDRVPFPLCFSLFLWFPVLFWRFCPQVWCSSISVNFPPFFRVHLCLVCQSLLCVHSLFAPSCLCQFVQCNSPEPVAFSGPPCHLVVCFWFCVFSLLFPLLLLVLCFSLSVANLYFGILPFLVLG